MYAKGVEAFVYNRTPAYDAIVERMKKHENEAGAVKGASHGHEDFEGEQGLRARLKNLARIPTKDSSAKGTPSDNGHSSSDSINWFREALPLELRVVTGSIVLGNDATPTLLIGDFKRAEGILETSQSRSLLDLYKMAVELKFHGANVLTRTNVDYSGPLLAHGKKVYDELLKQQADLANKPPSTISIFSGFHLLSRQFPFLYDPKFSTAPVPGLPTDKLWKGLARYRLPEDDATQSPRKEGGDEREYAKATNLLETPELTLTYYADIPGNVDLPPEYGIDIIIRKGTVKYGPWADRQRQKRASLLRDHITLISDLAKDWSSGTTGGDYHHFVPNHYNFRVSLINYAFHLYINDYNIVDAPGSRDSNDAIVAVASTQYRPETSVVPFSISLSNARVELCIPIWDTHRTFGPEVVEVGQVGQLTASGSYRYYAVPRPDHQETLTLHLEGKHVKFKMLGWVLRRLFCVKDNYFGSFTQFTTMDEFLERFDHDPTSVGDPVEEKYRPGRSDPYAVHITMNVEESLILMCDEIYNFSRGIALPVPQLQMAIKSVDQFMELSLNATPTYIAAAPQLMAVYERGSAPAVSGDETIFIEGIELKASRLFGPKPRATTYLCLWEANIPKLSAFLTPGLMTTLQAVGRSIEYTFSDPDNAPDQNYQLKTPPDDSNAISLEALSGLTLDTSTWGTRSYSSNIGLLLPSVAFNIIHRSPRRTWHVVSSATVGATLDVYNAPDRWQEQVSAQQEFLKEQDSETGRVWYMYRGGQKPMGVRDEEDIESSLSFPETHDYNSNDSQPSTSTGSEPEESNPFMPRGKRNPVKPFVTIQETDNSSVSSAGDESDSASSTSSGSSSEISSPAECAFDMADVLASKLRHFQFAHNRYPPEIRLSTSDSSFADGEEEIKGKGKMRDEMVSGQVVRLVTHAAQVDLHPESLQSLSEILSAISTGNISYEKRLDSLLVNQVQDVADSKVSEQQMILDIHVPSAMMRVSGGEPSIALISHLRHVKCNIHRSALINQRPVLDLTSSVVSISVSAMSSSDTPLSLRDIVGPMAGSPECLPLAHFVASAIIAGFHSGHGIRVHSKISHAHFHAVTPAITFGRAFAERWQTAMQKANFSRPKAGSDAAMLYHILYSAINSQRGTYLPSFAYVTPHGLHEQDSQLGNRRQTGWWLLTRFRDWLRGGLLDEAGAVGSISEMADYVVSNLIQVDDSLVGAENLVRDQPFFKLAFNTGSSCVSDTESHTPIDIFVYIDDASVRHYGRLLGSNATAMSYVNIGKLSLGCAIVTASVEERHISQMRMIVALQTARLEVHDSILALARLIVHIPCKPEFETGEEGESPRGSVSAINLQWKVKELPLYASAVDDMKAAIKAWTNGPPSKCNPILLADLDITLEALHFQVRAAKALWLRWDVGKIFVAKSEKEKDIRFAVKVAPQIVGAYSSRRSKSNESSSLNLPSVTVIGNHRHLQDKPHIFANLQLGLFSGVLRPAILDRLLSLHQNLQDDISHLVKDWRKDVRKMKQKVHEQKSGRSPSPGVHKVNLNKIFYDVHVGVDGVRFGLRADDVPATILFEALAAKGRATNQYHHGHGLHWRAKVDHFSLSLGHLGEGYVGKYAEPFRRQRTASMTLDVEVEQIPASPLSTSQLIIHLSHVRTVMHVEALSELADLLKSWSSDLYILRDHRAREMAEVKQQTTKVLKRFESAEHVNRSEVSWLANRLLTVEIGGIGVAIPLVEDSLIEDDRKSDVPALLYSIRVISFHNRHNETARFKMQNMALQFIDKFDQSLPEHFRSDFHGSKNCMVVPSIESEAEMSSTHDAWHLSAHCSASDFKLTLSPDISDGVIRLIELFERGKEKIAKMEAQYKAEVARHAKETIASKYESPASPSVRRQSQRIMVRTSFTFNSGTVELHRDLSDTEKTTLRSETRRSKGWHDTVVLPAVSLWMEYKGPKNESMLVRQDEEDGSLLFNLTANRLRRKTKRAQSTALDISPKTPIEASPAILQELPHRPTTRAMATRVQVRVTLRIDKSELRLSCASDSNAYVDLKWKSGGFFASTIIGDGSKATVAGTVSGVRAYLRHEFAEGKSCIEAGAKDMAFSIDYGFESLTDRKYLSIVLDSSLSAQFRLEQFSAWLAFAAVWLDNAPSLELPSRPPLVEASSSSPSVHTASTPRVTVNALVRFRTVDFDTNIGVTNAKLEMTPVVLRTSSNGVKAELELNLGVTQITAKGDISGEIRSESLVFRTNHQSSRGEAPNDRTVLNLSIDAGTLSSNLSLQEVSVIRFTLDPATVTLADDWQAFAQDPTSQVLLSFAVKAGVFRSVVRLLSIPALVSKFYSLSNTIESQERMACHRSSAYKSKRLRKSTEPSPMAAAILHTARKAGQTFTSTSTVKTAQNMRFDLGGVDIGLFNSTPTDDHRGDFYRFMIGKVEADLERQLTAGNLPKRDLNLLMSYVKWISSDGVKAAREVKKHTNLEESIQAASAHGRKEIASLPLMVYKTFDKLIKGLDQEQITKAKRRGDGGAAKARSHATAHEDDQACKGTALTFRRRLEGQRPLPVPRFRLLGEATGEAMAWVPKINAANAQLPIMVHRFVTSPLEDGMDLLLKLYEKQLPDRVPQQT
ncbi:hypothetical protein I307_02554 [Cryptococcus deuterogattii 99/473]|uniref:Fermentation associated protein n=1 Tax=Cryptococcus deuterogattii Ram5 TaxID=1296110 RepID=A0A0D0T291_9TREE|nr:hypothetical protein I313_04305 [Cryptococcus deuterogattii Ram5]KIY57880.1 hypothetical protein I307_02554 [Cryptococcus deuterogattii 99/473]